MRSKEAQVFFLSFVFLHVCNGFKQCQDLEPSLFSNCIKAGIDATVRLSSNESKELIVKSNLTRQTVFKLRKCSPYIEFLVCSVSTPQCLEGVQGPVLPCRRVCLDVMRGCDAHRVIGGDVEWLKGLCKLLPDEEPNTGKCIEPKDFRPQNSNVRLQKKCTKLFLPQCTGLGYNQTTRTFIEQLWLREHFDLILNKTRSNYTVCESVLRQLFCTELVSACFKQNQSEPAIYTICKPRCQVLWDNCPVVFNKQFGIFEDCTMAAERETEYEGLCRVTEWPGASRWIKVPVKPNVLVLTSSRQGPGISVGAVVISVVVVIVLGFFAIVVYNFFKKKRIFKLRGYYRHGDEEEEEEMTVVVSS